VFMISKAFEPDSYGQWVYVNAALVRWSAPPVTSEQNGSTHPAWQRREVSQLINFPASDK